MFKKVIHFFQSSMMKTRCVYQQEADRMVIIGHGLHSGLLPKRVQKIIKRLVAAGFEAYVVGGCVRDLLAGLQPKDFDIATNAKPEKIAELFRNCRLIGRRFRLAHILFGREIVEVATFRGNVDHDGLAKDDRGMLVSDNVYGSMADDAYRRDFTINALYYDLSSGKVIDYVGGFDDLKSKCFRTIGDVTVRFREDPVRILRAVRLMSKLSVKPDKKTLEAIEKHNDWLLDVSPARLFDELQKMLLRGRAEANFKLLHQFGVINILLPKVAQFYDDDRGSGFIEQALINTDDRRANKLSLNPGFLLGAMLWPSLQATIAALPKKHKGSYGSNLHQVGRQLLFGQRQIISIPKRYVLFVSDIWIMQSWFYRCRLKPALRLLYHVRFRAAYDFFLLRVQAGEVDASLAAWWAEFIDANMDERKVMTTKLPHEQHKK